MPQDEAPSICARIAHQVQIVTIDIRSVNNRNLVEKKEKGERTAFTLWSCTSKRDKANGR